MDSISLKLGSLLSLDRRNGFSPPVYDLPSYTLRGRYRLEIVGRNVLEGYVDTYRLGNLTTLLVWTSELDRDQAPIMVNPCHIIYARPIDAEVGS